MAAPAAGEGAKKPETRCHPEDCGVVATDGSERMLYLPKKLSRACRGCGLDPMTVVATQSSIDRRRAPSASVEPKR